MSLLKKMLAADISTKIEKSITPQQAEVEDPSIRRPTAPCPKNHTPPAGRHFWLDTFGCWHCTECDPPAVVAMVRDQVLIARDAGNALSDACGVDTSVSQPIFIQPYPDFRIAAVRLPDGSQTFASETTPAERRQIIDDWEWFDRRDASLQNRTKEKP